MRRPHRYLVAPDIPTAPLYLNPERGLFSIIVPIARTNLVTNPSIETNTTGYTAVGSSIAQSSADSYHGAYSLAVTPTATLTDGVYYGTVSLTSGAIYAYSCKFKGQAGRKYTISIATTGGVDLTAYTFTATGRWQWVWGYWAETSSTTRRFYIRKASHDSTAVFYVDGLQVEAINAGETVSTYIDGDQAGLLPNQFPYPFRWTGTPHASTSTRDGTTRAGGYVLNLDKFRFRVMGYAGLGAMLVANIANISAGQDGSTFQATIAQSRNVAFRGRFEAATFAQLQRQRSDLYDVIGPDSASPRQPLTLMYQAFDGQREIGDFGRIIASYTSGLEQNATPLPVEETTITFTQYLPAIIANERGAALTVSTSVANANGIIQRSPTGTWSALGTGTNAGGLVRTVLYASDGSLYAGGLYTLMGGVANTVSIARYVNGAWTALGTGAALGTEVREIVEGPDGSIYAVGTFTSMGGVANTSKYAKWNGSAWVSIGTAPNSDVSAAVFGLDGNLYVGGNFTTINGVAANYVAKFDGATWSALGAGPGANCTSLAVGLDGSIYAAGSYIKKWDGSSWTDIEGTAANVQEVSVGPNGTVYGGGNYSSIGGITTTSIARYNGTGWAAMGAGLTPAGTIRRVATDPLTGQVFVGGQSFTASGVVSFPNPVARWNGVAWTIAGISFPGTRADAVAFSSNGTLTLGTDSSGTATTEGITTITNSGTARAYPTITIKGPSSGTARIYHLLNITTGKFIFFNLTINAGETITMRTSPSGTTITSSSRGAISSTILPGSAADVALVRGSNIISFFASNSTVTALMTWANAYQSADDLTQ